MSDFLPLIAARTGGSPGGPDATAQIRRVTPAQLAQYAAVLLDWLAAESVVVRTASGVQSLTLPPSTLLGRGSSGSIRAMSAADLGALLGLSSLLASKSDVGHFHALADVAGLVQALANKAALNHAHPPEQIRATLVPNGHVMTAANGLGSWAPPSGGGGGGGNVSSPLTSDFDIADRSIVSSGSELLRLVGGRVRLGNALIPVLNEGTGGSSPQNRQVWIRSGSSWVHRGLETADVSLLAQVEEQGLVLNPATLSGLLSQLLSLISGRAVNGHIHSINDLQIPAGGSTGQVLGLINNSTWGLLTVSGGGGSVSPLTANLDIATHALVSGATEVIKVAAGKIILGGREVFPSAISAPAAGQVPVYDAVDSLFKNRKLAAAEVTTAVISGLAGADVQAMLANLQTGKLASTATTDAVAPGANAARQYANATSVAAAGAVMVDDIDDDDALGTATDVVPSQRAVKVYVDDALTAAGGLDGIPQGASFPGSPAQPDLFFLTGSTFELFVYITSISRWMATVEREWSHYTQRIDNGQGVGAGHYIVGTGNTTGFRAPFELLISRWTLHNVVVESGTVEIRTAPEGGTVTVADSVGFGGTRTATKASAIVVPAGHLVSVRANGCAVGINFAHISILYRRLG